MTRGNRNTFRKAKKHFQVWIVCIFKKIKNKLNLIIYKTGSLDECQSYLKVRPVEAFIQRWK